MQTKFITRLAMIAMVGFLVVLSPLTAKAAANAEVFGLTSITGVVGIATEPVSGFGTGFGLGVGAAFYHVNDIEIRADLTYLNWTTTEFGLDFSYTRLPLIVSGRMYFPANGTLRVYAQGGAGLSFDTAEVSACYLSYCRKVSASDTHFDLVPAGGVQLQITPVLAVGAEGGFHIVTDSYFTLLGTVTYSLDK